MLNGRARSPTRSSAAIRRRSTRPAAAERLGYRPAIAAATESEGLAEHVGREAGPEGACGCSARGPDCLVSGGEPVVRLIEPRARAGRPQPATRAGGPANAPPAGGAERIALLSGGTDGEDGPTDAAGACSTPASWPRQSASARSGRLPAAERRLPLLRAARRLIVTGPTHTNVCDLRVVVVDQDG